jgi:hypothetical protein
MPATYVPDLTVNYQIVESPTLVRIVRPGYIKGLRTMGLPSHRVAANVLNPTYVSGLPNYGDGFPDPRYSTVPLRQRIIEGIDGNNNRVNCTCVYEWTSGGFVAGPVTFILTRRTSTAEVSTEVHPDTLKPITVKWRNPVNPADFVERTARFRYQESRQVLTADGYYVGTPPDAMIDALNSVNASQWRGKGKGFWWYSGQSDVTRDYGNSYNVTLEVQSKLTKDWSQYDILEDQHGRHLEVPQVAVDLMKAAPYTYGVLSHNGITKVGLYPTADFNAIFGFGGIGNVGG